MVRSNRAVGQAATILSRPCPRFSGVTSFCMGIPFSEFWDPLMVDDDDRSTDDEDGPAAMSWGRSRCLAQARVRRAATRSRRLRRQELAALRHLRT